VDRLNRFTVGDQPGETEENGWSDAMFDQGDFQIEDILRQILFGGEDEVFPKRFTGVVMVVGGVVPPCDRELSRSLPRLELFQCRRVVVDPALGDEERHRNRVFKMANETFVKSPLKSSFGGGAQVGGEGGGFGTLVGDAVVFDRVRGGCGLVE